MPRAKGFFRKASGRPPAPAAEGAVRTRVAFLSTRQHCQVTFLIDTGSPHTVLFDTDFLAAIAAQGYPGSARAASEIVHWIGWQKHLFERQGPMLQAAGRTPPVYLMKQSVILFGRSRRGAGHFGPVRGAFSAGFLDLTERGCGHPSLLGRDILNQIKSFKWRWPREIALRL